MAQSATGSQSIYGLTFLATAMSFGHHVDHVIRGNAVGWPLTAQVNAFTASLAIYPVIATALLLYRAGRIGPRTWALVCGGGAGFVGAVHFGPFAVEPTSDILGQYEPPIVGWLAFAWLVAFVAILILTSLYEIRIWYSQLDQLLEDERHRLAQDVGAVAGADRLEQLGQGRL